MHSPQINALVVLLLFQFTSWSADVETFIWTDLELAAKERPAFLVQGEYEKEGYGLQIALFETDKVYTSIYSGGLRGAGWNGSRIEHKWGTLSDVEKWTEGYERVAREELGRKVPPPGAIVLFDGSDRDEWDEGAIDSGLLPAGTATKREFKDFTLHLEFRTPFSPDTSLTDPDRGNSGIYIFNRYEVQIIDSFAFDFDIDTWPEPPGTTPDQWCGCLYLYKTPPINLCLPPLAWQSYDIQFRAPRFEDGKKTANARITVYHNGVLIHDKVELPKGTGVGGTRPEIERGKIHLQSHGSPIYFRNIWILEE